MHKYLLTVFVLGLLLASSTAAAKTRVAEFKGSGNTTTAI